MGKWPRSQDPRALRFALFLPMNRVPVNFEQKPLSLVCTAPPKLIIVYKVISREAVVAMGLPLESTDFLPAIPMVIDDTGREIAVVWTPDERVRRYR